MNTIVDKIDLLIDARLAAVTSASGMQIENDYDKEVYNGDIGYVEAVDANEGELTASFDGRSVSYLTLRTGSVTCAALD